MRKVILSIFLFIILTSCNLNISKEPAVNLDKVFGSSSYENAFMVSISDELGFQGDYSEPGDFTFLIMTDTHFGYEEDNAYFVYDEFRDWVSENTEITQNLDFVAHLGDISNDSEPEEFNECKTLLETCFPNIPWIMTPGNHDNRRGGLDIYRQIFNYETTYYRFDYKGVHFYIPDSSFRTLGKTQYRKLIEALEADNTAPKVILSHVPLYGGVNVVYAAFSDTEERNGILKTIINNNVGLYMAGHNHEGNITEKYSGKSNELILSSMLGGTFRNIKPCFYIAEYKAGDNTLRVIVYEFDKASGQFLKQQREFLFPL